MSTFDYTKNLIRYNVNALSKLFGYFYFLHKSIRIDPATDTEISVFADKLEQSIPSQLNAQVCLF